MNGAWDGMKSGGGTERQRVTLCQRIFSSFRFYFALLLAQVQHETLSSYSSEKTRVLSWCNLPISGSAVSCLVEKRDLIHLNVIREERRELLPGRSKKAISDNYNRFQGKTWGSRNLSSLVNLLIAFSSTPNLILFFTTIVIIAVRNAN